MVNKSVYKFYRIAWTGLDWLYPPRCGGCDQSGSRWCEDCQDSTSIIKAPICQYCGRQLRMGNSCDQCLIERPKLRTIRSWALYKGPLQSAIKRLKYMGDIGLGEVLSRPLITMTKTLNWVVDMISPIPIGKMHQSKRGYNQSALLAFPVALVLGIQYCPDVLKKTRDVPSQVGLSRAERYLNVSGVFEGNPRLAENRTILLVDDVVTSGATMNACAQALLDSGARDVYGLTLAQAGI